MTDENKSEPSSEQGNASTGGSAEKESGDPGRTPGKAEGDEETVDESLSQKEA